MSVCVHVCVRGRGGGRDLHWTDVTVVVTFQDILISSKFRGGSVRETLSVE